MDKSRIITAYIFVIIAFTILFIRYAYLQLFGHSLLLKQAISNYSSIVASLPVRGGVVDRNGIPLADNKASYAIAILPKDINNIKDTLKKIEEHVNLTNLDIKKFNLALKKAKKYDWVIIKDELSNTEIAKLTAHNYEFPAVVIFARIKRFYPFDEMYAHSIGYIGRLSQSDKSKLGEFNKNYVNDDYIGKQGLEQIYENTLRGQLGRKVIKTDSVGNEIGLIDNIPAIDGYTIQLTLDHKLQKTAWQLLNNRKGAIVAIDPKTGGILTFVSQPGYDPNWFIDGISTEDWSELTIDPNKPLINRASQGTYPPGSTFKPFLALAALYAGTYTREHKVNDPGYFTLPGSSHKFRGSQRYGLGAVDMSDAIKYSSDVYFYKLALDMGINKANETLPWLGFGKKTNIDLPNENPGLLPSASWKAKRFAKNPYQRKWLPADSVTFGVGQGFNHYTPLQMAFATSIIANDGIAIYPHFLDKVTDNTGQIIKQYQIKTKPTPFNKSDIEFIKQAMQKVIQGGTAQGISYNLQYTLAGKTGTAQVVGMKQNNRTAKFQGLRFKDHAWFIAFAPVEDPKIAIAVLVENGGWGGATAAPIARQLLDSYLIKKPNIEKTAIEDTILSNNIEEAESEDVK